MSRHFTSAAWICAAGLLGAGCYDHVFPPPVESDETPYHVTMSHAPEMLHAGDLAVLVFAVTHDGEPLPGLDPEAWFQKIEGGTATGVIDLWEGSAPGTYSGHVALPGEGLFEITFRFLDADTSFSRTFFLEQIVH